jgi:subtilisin family serine protease
MTPGRSQNVRVLSYISSIIPSSQLSVADPQSLRSQDGPNPLDLVTLSPLMQMTKGSAETKIGLIDGPVDTSHPELSAAKIHEVPGTIGGVCERANSIACMHGTFVAGILCANRGAAVPAICPDCTLLVRPIFAETTSENGQMPSATPEELAFAIVDCIEAGAHVVNLSAALTNSTAQGERRLEAVLDYAAKRGVIVVAAAGNQGDVGSSAVTRHPWVIPVIASDLRGRPLSFSNVGNSIGRRGLSAPGQGIRSVAINGQLPALGGTSAAAPFVTGAIALLMSIFPNATATAVKLAITGASGARRTTVIPPLLNAWAAYQNLRNLS